MKNDKDNNQGRETRTNEIILRPATTDDMPLLNAWCYMNGMDNLPGPDGVTVALIQNVHEKNETLRDAQNEKQANTKNGSQGATPKNATHAGFIRIVHGSNGYAHVNPIVVDADNQKQGIGKVLTQDALQKHGELRFVSRGSSVAFYEKLGAVEIPWSDVDLNVTDDCDGCPMRIECNPKPMKLSVANFPFEKN